MTDNKGFDSDDIDVNIPQSKNNSNDWKSTSKKVFTISKHMIPSKIVFALAGAVAGSFYPYINVFLTSIGLTVSAAGFIGGIRLVSSFIIGPLWGFLIDHTGQRKLIFTALCLGTGLTIFSLPWTAHFIAYQENNETYRLLSDFNHSIVQDQKNDYDSTANQYGFSSKLFYIMLFTIVISNFFDIPLQGLIDSFVMNVAHSKGSNDSFGMQKVYHSVFFGLANFLAGVVADQFKDSQIKSEYTGVFLVFLPCALLLIPAGIFLLRKTQWKENIKPEESEEKKTRKTKLLRKMFKNVDNLLFLISVCLVGVASAVLLGYLFMLMDHEMNASKSCMGLSVLVSCLIQVLLFPSSHRIIKRIGSITCIELALITYFIRFMMVSYITNPNLIIPTQLFHCVGFALFWAAAVEHVEMISPKEIYCTMYSLLTSVYWGLGGIIGNMLGGMVYTHFGGRCLFRWTAMLCAVWSCVMILYFHLFKRLIKSEKRQTTVAVITDMSSNGIQPASTFSSKAHV